MNELLEQLKRRILAEHGGTFDPWQHHGNLTHGDSIMHREAAAELERMRAENEALLTVKNAVQLEVNRLRDAHGLRFAGWFSEIPSAMSYRLWEQGGYEQLGNEVALYEA